MKILFRGQMILMHSLLLLGLSGSLLAHADAVLSDVAQEATRPASAPKYSDVCFRYGWIRETIPEKFIKDTARGIDYPKIDDAKEAIRNFHATRIDWFYTGSHTANRDADYVTGMSKEFIDWCHARGMKVIGAMNTNTSVPEWGHKKAYFSGRYIGDLDHPEFTEAALAWGKAMIDAGIDGIICDDIFGYRSDEDKKRFCDEVLGGIKAHKPGFEIAGNKGTFIGTAYVKSYDLDYHYSDNSFIPSPGQWWQASREHRALNSAFLLHPNKQMSKEVRRQQIGLSYGAGAHMIAPWDEYIHGKLPSGSAVPRLFAEPADYADLYGFVRALGQMGLLDRYEDAAVAGYDLKEDRYGEAQPIVLPQAAETVSVFARAMPGEQDRPVVIHLIDMASKEPFELKLRKPNFFGERAVQYQLLRPKGYSREGHEKALETGDYKILVEVMELTPINEGEFITMMLPILNPWGVVVVSPQ